MARSGVGFDLRVRNGGRGKGGSMLARLKVSGDTVKLLWDSTPAGDRRTPDEGAVVFLHETAEHDRGLQ